MLGALLGQPLPAVLVQDVQLLRAAGGATKLPQEEEIGLAFEEEEQAPSDDFGTVIGVGGGSTLRNGGRGRVGLLRDAFDEDEEEIGGGRGGGPRGGGGGFALD